MKPSNFFIAFSQKVAYVAGHPAAFVCAFGVIIIWGLCGPIFGYSDTWQLIINTSTTIITFLMVFLIQSTQNRDTAAIQLKLDELIRVTDGAHAFLMDLEELSEGDLEKIRKQYEMLAAEARLKIRRGEDDTTKPDIDVSKICFSKDD